MFLKPVILSSDDLIKLESNKSGNYYSQLSDFYSHVNCIHRGSSILKKSFETAFQFYETYKQKTHYEINALVSYLYCSFVKTPPETEIYNPINIKSIICIDFSFPLKNEEPRSFSQIINTAYAN